MKRSLKFSLAISVILAMVLVIGLGAAFAQKYSEFKGKVVSIDKKLLSVKDDKGMTMNFVLGRKTQYAPNRRPAIGETVEVEYFMKKGASVAFQIKTKAEQ
jgi:hypothetical protein